MSSRETLRSILGLASLVAFLLSPASMTGLTGSAGDVSTIIKEIIQVPSVTGNEELLATKVRALLPDSWTIEVDNLGSVYATLGGGEGRGGLAILSPLDEFGWFVSAIPPDGFLRLDRAAIPPHPLVDSFLLGHAVVISTEAGLKHGVIAQPSMHLLTREKREALTRPIPLDFLYLDVGARSDEEVRAKGIDYLDPVSFKPELIQLANEEWAGPSLGVKALCAALLEAARKGDRPEESQSSVYLGWMAQTRFLTGSRDNRVSLGAGRAQARLQPGTVLVLETLPAGDDENGPFLGQGPVLWKPAEEPSPLGELLERAAKKRGIHLQHRIGGESRLMAPFLADKADIIGLALPVKFSQTPSEIISLKDVRSLAELISGVLVEE